MTTFLILAGGRSTRFDGDKLLERFEGQSLPARAARFAVANGATRLCLTLSKTRVTAKADRITHPVLEDVLEAVQGRVAVDVLFQPDEAYGVGAAITVWANRINEPFIVLFGDNFYFGRLPEFKHDTLYLSKRRLDKPNPRHLQLAAIQHGFMLEKPHGLLMGDYFCGFVHFPTGTWEWLPNLRPSSRNEYELADIVNMAPKREIVDLDEAGIRWGDITYKADIATMANVVNDVRF